MATKHTFEYKITFIDEDGSWYSDIIVSEVSEIEGDEAYPEGIEERAREIADSRANYICDRDLYYDYEIQLMDSY